MSRRPRMEGLLFAVLLLVTLLAVATNKLTPVVVSNDSITDRPAIARAYPGLTISSFEFESRWDKGALWDDQAPAYDLSYSNR
jgi:hypothetical protein